MQAPDNDRERPREEALSDVVATDSHSLATDAPVRCTRCGASLTAAKSVRLEVGPVCIRREVAA